MATNNDEIISLLPTAVRCTKQDEDMHKFQLKAEPASTARGDTLHYTGRSVYGETAHRVAGIEAA